MHQSTNSRKRRINVDPSQRIYICGCGKAYLSNPALYIHTKQKHCGIYPPGVKIPSKRNGLQEQSKPGPKYQAKMFNTNFKKITLTEEDMDENDAIDDFYIYLSEQQSISQQLIQPVLCGTIDPIKKFPISILQSLKCEYKELFSSIQELHSIELNLPEINRKNCLRSTSLNNLIAFFLLRIYQDLTEKCYQEIVVLLSLLNDKIQKTSDNMNFQESAEVPKWCATFLNNNWQQICYAFGEKFQSYKFKLLGPEHQQYKNGQFIIQCFMNWVRLAKFSKQKIIIVNTNLEKSEFNEEESLEQNSINLEEHFLNQFLNLNTKPKFDK